jgi:hypothetical protein
MDAADEAIPLNLYRPSRPGLARVVANVRLSPPGTDDVRHIVLDLEGLDFRYREGQSLGVLTPGSDEAGRPHKLRLYSIASTRRGDDGLGRTVSLCVKRVAYVEPTSGLVRRGPASNYLCDLEVGDAVAITGPVGRHFLLPDDPNADLILIATGNPMNVALSVAVYASLVRAAGLRLNFPGSAAAFGAMTQIVDAEQLAEAAAWAAVTPQAAGEVFNVANGEPTRWSTFGRSS